MGIPAMMEPTWSLSIFMTQLLEKQSHGKILMLMILMQAWLGKILLYLTGVLLIMYMNLELGMLGKEDI